MDEICAEVHKIFDIKFTTKPEECDLYSLIQHIKLFDWMGCESEYKRYIKYLGNNFDDYFNCILFDVEK